jgi:ribosome-binding factor A
MRQFREAKAASVLKQELNNLLLRDLEFENALVTITSVEVSSDLLQAKVGVGIIPEDKGKEVLAKLERRKRELQHKILKKTKLRNVPKLVFVIDK